MRDLVAELALGLRAHVLPLLGSHAGRAHVQAGAGGDVTFEIDGGRGLPGAIPGRAGARCRVLLRGPGPGDCPHRRPDPQGSRCSSSTRSTARGPAMAGLESCCVSVAAAPLGRRRVRRWPTSVGCVVEIKSGATFLAERGAGIEISGPTEASTEPALSPNTDIARMFWTLGFRGRPAVPLMEVLGELIDASSVGGAVFDLGSATFDMTRIVTGQLDAYVDVGTRMIERGPRGCDRGSRRSAAGPCSTTLPTTSPPPSCASRRPAPWSPTPAESSLRTARAARIRPRVPDVLPGGRQRGPARARARRSGAGVRAPGGGHGATGR